MEWGAQQDRSWVEAGPRPNVLESHLLLSAERRGGGELFVVGVGESGYR